MATEQEIRNYLSTLTYQVAAGNALALDPKRNVLVSIESRSDLEPNLSEDIMRSLLKDEIVRTRYPDFWTELFIQGISTFGRF